ncbi:MAG: T9SS type A sorting domain-containing protein [Bacteroidetes bacterium]|nr:T9SS type A sorting domain-containing protein [Bacteroidota bacterium]
MGAQTHSDTIVFNNLSLLNNTSSFDILLLKSDLPTEIKSTPNDVLDGKFITYPNPGTGKFQVICNLPIQRISVTNLFGQIVFSDDISTNNHQQYSFDLYQPGIYILTVQVSTGLLCRKIVVQ